MCLTVGLSIAKAMSASLKKPLVAINHLEGHALSPRIMHKISFPFLLLLISGGHTQFLEVAGVHKEAWEKECTVGLPEDIVGDDAALVGPSAIGEEEGETKDESA